MTAFQEFTPRTESRSFSYRQPHLFENRAVQSLCLHQKRYFIDCFCVDRLYDSLIVHIAELSHFLAKSIAQRVFGTEHQYVRLDTYALEFLDRVLCRFRFQLSGSGKIRNIGQVYT